MQLKVKNTFLYYFWLYCYLGGMKRKNGPQPSMSKASPRTVKAASLKEQHAAEETARPRMSPVETAQYIAEFAAELSSLARQTRLDLLAYLLDMARMEASRAVKAEGRNP